MKNFIHKSTDGPDNIYSSGPYQPVSVIPSHSIFQASEARFSSSFSDILIQSDKDRKSPGIKVKKHHLPGRLYNLFPIPLKIEIDRI